MPPLDQKLRLFVVVARTGSLRAACDLLGLTQPALSKQVRQLEQQLGTTLFHRDGRGMVLSREGQALQARIGSRFTELDRTVADFTADLRSGGQFLTLSSGSATAVYLVPGVVAAAKARFPAAHVTVLTANAPDVLEQVRRGVADIGLVYDISVDSAHFDVLRLFEERLCVVRRRGAPGPANYTAASLLAEPLVLPLKGLALRRILETELGQALSPSVECGSMDTALLLTAHGLGITVLPAHLPPAFIGALDLECVPIQGGRFSRWLAAVRRVGSAPSPLVDFTLDCLQALPQPPGPQAGAS